MVGAWLGREVDTIGGCEWDLVGRHKADVGERTRRIGKDLEGPALSAIHNVELSRHQGRI
jgi:hypothetical protein